MTGWGSCLEFHDVHQCRQYSLKKMTLLVNTVQEETKILDKVSKTSREEAESSPFRLIIEDPCTEFKQ